MPQCGVKVNVHVRFKYFRLSLLNRLFKNQFISRNRSQQKTKTRQPEDMRFR